MAERNRFDLLDDAIEAMLAGERSTLPGSAELATLLVVAADLRELPDPAFKAMLRRQLFPAEMEEAMTTLMEEAVPTMQEITPGVHTVVPYLSVHGAEELLDFLHASFGAEELLRVPREDGTLQHAEVRIGNALVQMGDTTEQAVARATPLHVYLDDADAAFARALAAGATELFPMTDQAYGDREGGVRDRWGNHWYIATHQEELRADELARRFAGGTWTAARNTPSVVPPGLRSVTVGLRVNGAAELMQFLERAFGAREVGEATILPDQTILHAKMRLGDSVVELGEARGAWGPMQVGLHLFVDDVDATFARAVAAGATSIYAPIDMPYGERSGSVQDPFGNLWYIARLL